MDLKLTLHSSELFPHTSIHRNKHRSELALLVLKIANFLTQIAHNLIESAQIILHRGEVIFNVFYDRQ